MLTKKQLKEIYRDCKFTIPISFETIWQYKHKGVRKPLHELAHYAIKPDWYLEAWYAYKKSEGALKAGDIPYCVTQNTYGLWCDIDKDLNKNCLAFYSSRDIEKFSLKDSLCSTFNQHYIGFYYDRTPGEYAAVAWQNMVLDLYGWKKSSDVVHPVGLEQLDYWGMNPGLRPFDNWKNNHGTLTR